MANGDGDERAMRTSLNIFYDRYMNTDLHYAVAANDKEKVVEEIQKKKYDINFGNDMGWTPLMLASRYGNFELVNILIDAGADATRCNRYDASIFDMAVGSGNLDVVNRIASHLLNGGVSRESLESIISPFSISVIFNQKHMIQYFHEKSFKVNAWAVDTGITPAMFAAVLKNSEILQQLLTIGADPNQTSFCGESVRSIMNNNNSPVIVNNAMTNLQNHYNNSLLSPYHAYGYNRSPAPTFFCFAPYLRRSSNTHTPVYLQSPNLSPVLPLINHSQQMFFSPTTFPVHSSTNGFFNYVNENCMPEGDDSVFLSATSGDRIQ